jgi:cytochrome P450
MLRSAAREHGDAFTIDLGTHGLYAVFADPKQVKEIFTGDAATFHAGKGNRVLAAFLGRASLLLLEEGRHLDERRLLMPAFHHGSVAAWGQAIVEIAEAAVEAWSDGGEMVAQREMQAISLEVILRVVFGMREDEARSALGRELAGLLDDPKMNLALMGRLDHGLDEHASWRAFRERFAHARGLVRALVEARRRDDGDGDDVVRMLVAARHEDGSALDDEAIVDELFTLVVTGHETTATALSWALHWIAATPAAQARTVEVARAAGAQVTRDPWMDAVAKETLRLHPVIPIVAREVQRDVRVGGWEIPAGVTVAPCIYLVHQRADLYPEPQRFRPERFLERSFGPHEWLPFGGGARRCLGASLAMLEIKLVLAAVLRRFEIRHADEDGPGAVRPVRRSVTVAPSGGPRFTLERRKAA